MSEYSDGVGEKSPGRDDKSRGEISAVQVRAASGSYIKRGSNRLDGVGVKLTFTKECSVRQYNRLDMD